MMATKKRKIICPYKIPFAVPRKLLLKNALNKYIG